MEPQTNMAPVELAIVNQILAERRELAVTAARLSPPPTSQRSWGNAQRSGEAEDLGSGVEAIEVYRQEHRVTDPVRALGAEPTGGIEDQRAQRLLREAQLNLDREVSLERSQELGRGGCRSGLISWLSQCESRKSASMRRGAD